MSMSPTLPPVGETLASSLSSLSSQSPSSSLMSFPDDSSSTSSTSRSSTADGTATAANRSSNSKFNTPPLRLSIHTTFTSNAEHESPNIPTLGRELHASSSKSGMLHSSEKSPVSTHGSSSSNIHPNTLPFSSNRSWWRSSTVPRSSEMEDEVRINVRKRVLKAVLTTVINVGNVSHEALALGVDFLDLAPVPCLRTAGQLVLDVWSAVEQVTINRLASLRLAERCADILLSVRLEIKETGDVVGEELKAPLVRLEQSFKQICEFLHKNNERPLLMRYLKRDEIVREISNLDGILRDALGMFSYSVQIRILKQVLESERQRQVDTHAILRHLSARNQRGGEQEHTLPLTNRDVEETISFTRNRPVSTTPSLVISVPLPPFSELRSTFQHSQKEIIQALQECLALQNTTDIEKDMENLRDSMRNLVQSSDLEVVDALGIGRGEIIEAIKTLQRALERETDEECRGNVIGDKKGKGREGEREMRTRIVDRFCPPGREDQKEKEGKYSLDREFMETSLDALRRMSHGVGMDFEDLPGWTITRYELDRDVRIGKGFFSVVYRGTWRGMTVAIKVLDSSTQRNLFKREVEIWKHLKHPNVLHLFGASSTAGDPPWYFVSPFMRNGNLVEYLRNTKLGGRQADISGNDIDTEREVQRDCDLWRFMHEIAKGMQYLHSHSVLHGDLKAVNVLVDDGLHCVISDFGQSEMKNEVYRLSGMGNPHGTLRWQAPELMSGNTPLTAEMDVYAYSIVCVEVLTLGKMSWLHSDDDAVRRFVLVENTRPTIPATRFYSPLVQDLLRKCWARDPKERPSFAFIVQALKAIRISTVENTKTNLLSSGLPSAGEDAHISPDLLLGSFSSISDMEEQSNKSYSDMNIITNDDPVPVVNTPTTGLPHSLVIDKMPELPVIIDQRMAMRRDERRYRLLLEHNFHQSLNLPLWSPSPVEIGAVGYLLKPEGTFVTLFNAFSPQTASHPEIRILPSVYGYGHFKKCNQKIDHRSIVQKGTDNIIGLLTFRKDEVTSNKIIRKITFPLKAGRKVVALYTEQTNYHYVDSLDALKRWFKAHVHQVTRIYGVMHDIRREDLFLVFGSLQTPNHALLVSHRHPDGHAYFNVFASPSKGQPWGSFTTDSVVRQVMGPKYNDRAEVTRESGIKISRNDGIWNSVILARLRFKPDDTEPTPL